MTEKSLTAQLSAMNIEPVVFRAMQDMHPGANTNSLMMMLRYCQASQLDPLRAPVVILPIDGKQVPVLSLNGLRAHASRTGRYAGSRTEYAGSIEDVDGLSLPTWCKCTVQRVMDDGSRAEFEGLAFAREAVSRTKAGKPTPIWRQRGIHMLAVAAERLALRRGFPESVPADNAAPARNQIDPNTGEIHSAAPLHLSDEDIAAGVESIDARDEWLDDYDAA